MVAPWERALSPSPLSQDHAPDKASALGAIASCFGPLPLIWEQCQGEIAPASGQGLSLRGSA